VLRHWVAKRGLNENTPVTNVENAEGEGKEDTTMTGAGDSAAGEGDDVAGGEPMQLDEVPPDPDYHFAKFNIKPNILRYTDAEYALATNTKPKSLSDPKPPSDPNTTTTTEGEVQAEPEPETEEIEPEGWTRSETDYLFSLCEEYDLRFPIIHDRYSYLPPPTSTSPPPPTRSLEDLKHRYYSITQSLLSQRTPVHLMTPQEHQFYTLHSFDRAREVSRKRIAETLFNRTPDEIKEEEFLLAEMKRILANQERLLEERQDLWNRLDAPASSGSIAAYMGSAGLGNLGLLVGVGEKGKKRKSIAGMVNIDTSSAAVAAAGGAGQGATPNTAAPTPTTSRPEKKHSHSHSISSASGATFRDLKDPNNTIPSTPSATPQSSTFPPPSATRPLSPQTQAHYGVSYPTEKQSSGVYLRSSKIGSIKGASQPKVQAALNELGVPVKLVMSTEKTCKRMEGLNSVVGMVLDARRLLERLEGELRIERGRLENLG